MKIAIIGKYEPSEILGGPEKCTKRFYEQMSLQFDCLLVDYFRDGYKYSYFKKLFGKKEYDHGRIKIVGVFRLLKELLFFNPSFIVISSFERFVIISFVVKYLKQIPVFYWVNGVVYYENQNSRQFHPKLTTYKNFFVEYFVMFSSDKLFFLSENSINIAKTYYQINSNKIVLISNGVDEIFCIQKGKKEFTGQLKMVFVGDEKRLEKGFQFLYDTLSEYKGDNLILYIIAENSSLINLKKINQTEVIVVQKMSTSKYSDFLQDMHLFILPSISETFSISCAEAMKSGVIPIVEQQAGISRFIEDSKNGFVFNYGDKYGLLKKLSIINSIRDQLKFISMNASKTNGLKTWKEISSQIINEFYNFQGYA